MTEKSNFFKSPEDDDEEEDENGVRRKKDRVAEFLADIFKEDNAEDETDKNDASPLDELLHPPDRKDRDDEPEKAHKDELSEADKARINSELADEHLQNPTVPGEPEGQVTDFLEQVKDGTPPEEAFKDQMDSLDEPSDGGRVDDRNETPNQAAPEADRNDSTTNNETAPNHNGPETAQASESDNSEEASSEPTPEDHGTGEGGTDGHEGSGIDDDDFESRPVGAVINRGRTQSAPGAALTAAAVLGGLSQRRRNKTTKLTTKPVSPKPYEDQIRTMERKLSNQELVIQRLVQQNRLRPVVLPPERSQLPKQESRLELVKPTSLERIGKMAVEPSRQFRPEAKAQPESLAYERDVLTMSRSELLAISAKIIVNGASLKSMFENNLFNEKALRRMVDEHLRGKDIVPLLRKELVSKEVGYDEPVSDQKSIEKLNLHQVADQSRPIEAGLAAMPSLVSDALPRPTEQIASSQPNDQQTSNKTMTNSRPVLINVVMALAAVIVILIIVWFLLRHRS